MSYLLKVLTGKYAGNEARFTKPHVLIGRGSDCEIRPPCNRVSRHHCRITIEEDGEIWIRDLNSTNGTSVEGTPVFGSRQLQSEDKIRVGSIIFRVTILQTVETGQAPGFEDSVLEELDLGVDELISEASTEDGGVRIPAQDEIDQFYESVRRQLNENEKEDSHVF
ncbi:Hypothetical protein PBC10988_29560 [Planctomycetales bacterium 10988]|nr:Hypothetical protein PBC10988_29560 [Planctomycetales bacterium 10988]